MELGGKKHNELFYPSFSGVAQSFNYYPISYMQRKEGILFTALGFGKTIVDGEKSLRFSPKYPKILPQYYSIKSIINNSQNKFYALDMNKGKNPLKYGESKNLKKFDLSIAENADTFEGLSTLYHLSSESQILAILKKFIQGIEKKCDQNGYIPQKFYGPLNWPIAGSDYTGNFIEELVLLFQESREQRYK